MKRFKAIAVVLQEEFKAQSKHRLWNLYPMTEHHWTKNGSFPNGLDYTEQLHSLNLLTYLENEDELGI